MSSGQSSDQKSPSSSTQSSENIPPEEIRFKDNVTGLIEFVHELISQCFDEGKTTIDPNLIQIAANFVGSFDSNILIKHFIKKSYKYWDNVLDKEESFFRDNCADVFGDLPMKEVNAFQDLFNSEGDPIINQDDKDYIWEYFNSLIKISIKYVHKERGPKIRDLGKGKGPQRVYTCNIFSGIDLRPYVKRLSITLDW